jgi:hypothetical protein
MRVEVQLRDDENESELNLQDGRIEFIRGESTESNE